MRQDAASEQADGDAATDPDLPPLAPDKDPEEAPTTREAVPPAVPVLRSSSLSASSSWLARVFSASRWSILALALSNTSSRRACMRASSMMAATQSRRHTTRVQRIRHPLNFRRTPHIPKPYISEI